MTATLKRAFFAVPVLGWIANDILNKGSDNIWYAIMLLVSLIGIATVIWGVVALSMAALTFVPVMMLVLIGIAAG